MPGSCTASSPCSHCRWASRTGFGVIGTVSIAGISRTSAPSLRRREAISDMCSFGLVSRIFLPARGRFSAHAKDSASLQTSPTTMIAGAWIPARRVSSSSVETVATRRLCLAVVPFSSTAAGMAGSMPASRSPRMIMGRAARPIRKISVPFVRTSVP